MNMNTRNLPTRPGSIHSLSTWLIALFAAFGLVWEFEKVARAEEVQCTSTLGAQQYEEIVVPDGQSCTLNGTHVDGNIKVGTGSTLQANNVRVGGNIQAEGSSNVVVTTGSVVDGNIQIKQGGGASVAGVRVNGDIQIDSSRDKVETVNNQVGGNIQIMGNNGGVLVLSNNIDGNLQCKENNPVPEGANNRADSLEDQCATFSIAVAQQNFHEKLYIFVMR